MVEEERPAEAGREAGRRQTPILTSDSNAILSLIAAEMHGLASRSDLERLEERIVALEERIAALEGRSQGLSAELESLIRTVERLEERIVRLEDKIGVLEEWIHRLEESHRRLEEAGVRLEQRMGSVEGSLQLLTRVFIIFATPILVGLTVLLARMTLQPP